MLSDASSAGVLSPAAAGFLFTIDQVPIRLAGSAAIAGIDRTTNTATEHINRIAIFPGVIRPSLRRHVGQTRATRRSRGNVTRLWTASLYTVCAACGVPCPTNHVYAASGLRSRSLPLAAR